MPKSRFNHAERVGDRRIPRSERHLLEETPLEQAVTYGADALNLHTTAGSGWNGREVDDPPRVAGRVDVADVLAGHVHRVVLRLQRPRGHRQAVNEAPHLSSYPFVLTRRGP